MHRLLSIGVVILLGCGSEVPTATPGDAPNPPLATAPLWEVGEPELQIGTLDGPPITNLFGVHGIDRLSDGSFVIVNMGSSDVRVFDPDGAPRFAFGRAGEGPGEFTYPSTVWVSPNDSIWVEDFRYSLVFSPEGAFARRVDHPTEGLDIKGGVLVGHRLDQDRYLLPSVSPIEPINEFVQPIYSFISVTWDPMRQDTIATTLGIEQMDYRPTAGTQLSIVRPSPPAGTWAADNFQPGVVFGRQDRAEVIRAGLGTKRDTIRWEPRLRPLGQEELNAWRESYTLNYPEQIYRDIAPLLDDIEVPKSMHQFQQIATGRDGSVWVTLPEAPGTWHMFDQEGVLRLRVEFPDDFLVRDAGDGRVWGIARDELDVEYVRVYSIPDKFRM